MHPRVKGKKFTHVYFLEETRMKIKIGRFRGVFQAFEKNKCKKINFFKLTKMKIKIFVLHSNFQLFRKKMHTDLLFGIDQN